MKGGHVTISEGYCREKNENKERTSRVNMCPRWRITRTTLFLKRGHEVSVTLNVIHIVTPVATGEILAFSKAFGPTFAQTCPLGFRFEPGIGRVWALKIQGD